MENKSQSLKHLTARSIKWNVIDRVGSQLLYAATGIVLARELSQEAFGLVGAMLVFQAFALMFVDSGFSYALIQRKRPTEVDYSSVFWFNLLVACVAYAILWLAAPLIAQWFGGDSRLIPLSRVMFLSFIINATAIVQTNRLMKRMDFRPIAITNVLGLVAGAIVGIWLAFSGAEAWAIVWQTITVNSMKSLGLWIWCRWCPLLKMSWSSLRSFFKVASGMMMTSFLNTLFLNIYSFFIGNKAGLVQLGYYTQSDKWSKMGVMAISQVLTSSFLPVLSEVQDDRTRFCRVVSKMNRFTAYILFPAMLFLIVTATPLFHILFGVKWDPSIILFQLLLARGIFTVLNSLYNNYLLSLGHSRTIFKLEVLRDGAALVGIIATLPMISLSTVQQPVMGLVIFMSGQIAASAITWIVTIVVTARYTEMKIFGYLKDLAPYAVTATLISLTMWAESLGISNPWIAFPVEGLTGIALYLAINRIFPSKIQREVFAYLRGGKRMIVD